MAFKPVTLVHTIVEPNGELGVGRIMRTREHAKSIVRLFDPPRLDLLGVDFDAMSDEQIEALGSESA